MVLLTTKEAANMLRLAPNTLALWRARKQGPPWVQIGGQRGTIRYPLDMLNAWIESRAEHQP